MGEFESKSMIVTGGALGIGSGIVFVDQGHDRTAM